MRKRFAAVVGGTVLVGALVAAPTPATAATPGLQELPEIAHIENLDQQQATVNVQNDNLVRMIAPQQSQEQIWRFGEVSPDEAIIVNHATRTCLQIPAVVDPNHPGVVHAACQGTNAEVWEIEPLFEGEVVRIISSLTGECLTNPGPFVVDPVLSMSPCEPTGADDEEHWFVLQEATA